MAFEYVLWVSPEAYETLYRTMVSRGGGSLKGMIKELLTSASPEQVGRALELARERELMRGSRDPIFGERKVE